MDFEKKYIYECNISAKATNYLLQKISFYPINKLNLSISHERISLAGMAIVGCNQLNASFMHVGLPSYTEQTSVQAFHIYIFASLLLESILKNYFAGYIHNFKVHLFTFRVEM